MEDLDAAYLDAQDDVKKLDKLRARIAGIKVFDPACGSGNFLVVAYKELRGLEHRILQRKLDILGYDAGVIITDDSVVKLDHFFGIDIDEFATEVARLSLWLAKHQMNLQFRELFSVDLSLVPLKDAGKIVCGNAARLAWKDVCPMDRGDEAYVCGNPPYLGSSMQTAEHRRDLRGVVGEEGDARLDYVACWLVNGARYSHDTGADVGFVVTNSVTQGIHIAKLWPLIFASKVRIRFAYSQFRWSNSAHGQAGVTVAIVGLSTKPGPSVLYSDDQRVVVDSGISPYLTRQSANAGPFVLERRSPLSAIQPMTSGSKPADGGHLILSALDREKLFKEAPDASQFVRRCIGAAEYIKNVDRYCLWIADADVELALRIPAINERIERVRAFRLLSQKRTTRDSANFPWRFQQIRHRELSAILVPKVNSERREYIPIGYVSEDTVISDLAFAVYDAPPWLFGLLQSRMHNAWARAVAGRLGTGIRYSATLVYNTFPIPELDNGDRDALAKRAGSFHAFIVNL